MGLFKKKKKAKKLIAITVEVFRTGGKGCKVALNGRRTIEDALKSAGFQKKETEIVSVNGEEVDDDVIDTMELNDGDKIVLVKNIEGGLK